jgi:UDPglucose--hexose-1-phosphate uridylyltransferase
MLEWLKGPHRRLNLLTHEWLLVSPHRAQRPWQGENEIVSVPPPVPYDPACYLCPRNKRAGEARNPDYTSTFLFDNDFPALVPEAENESLNDNGLLIATPERGICRVMCFSPRHDLTLPSMEPDALNRIVETWCAESAQLRTLPFIQCVQIFENRGALMGASNPHPHCQIWATEHVPNELVKEDRSQFEYKANHGACLLCGYLNIELNRERVVVSNDSFVALVPFWAIWPFEVMVVSRRHCDRIEHTSHVERLHLGSILREITNRFDRLFGVPFPYSMGFHERPGGSSAAADAWHWHAHFYPPLLRSASVRKFMVGFELLAGPQRDLTPEAAAQRLREV